MEYLRAEGGVDMIVRYCMKLMVKTLITPSENITCTFGRGLGDRLCTPHLTTWPLSQRRRTRTIRYLNDSFRRYRRVPTRLTLVVCLFVCLGTVHAQFRDVDGRGCGRFARGKWNGGGGDGDRSTSNTGLTGEQRRRPPPCPWFQ